MFHDHIAELRAERRAIKAELGRLSPRAAAMEGASIEKALKPLQLNGSAAARKAAPLLAPVAL